ncbi:hypothetical protein CAI21_12970 [Alkalilimnicola ehrlichii]|uniref:Outer membrane protein assembly factor BamE n=2 Tax=Alkalilimnicola ehrlichii TaxID=351052 RepID=A0A3E0WRL3_9GAMM|nr:hypothetical protein CAI21_12970 [Alkalilimnicola ehrlichii]RFA34833.1 hypothetical protein CAL65_14105 [Alkalilimnicola ehrlichii]
MLRMMRTLACTLLYISVIGLAACSNGRIPFTYAVEVQQGNIIEEEALERLEPGMTRRQVEHLLGSPTLTPVHNERRWEYIYTLQQDGRRVDYKRVTVLFDESDRVTEIKRQAAEG